MSLRLRRSVFLAGLLLLGLALGLRWPTFGAGLWNVDEAIHATAARTLLDGGVLYRDAVDQRTPLSYYVVAAIFAVAGENNLWTVRAFIALLIAGTGLLLAVAGRTLRNPVAGLAAGVLYVLLATSALFQGDANAANTEWFVAFFSSAAAVVFLAGAAPATPRRLVVCGALLGAAFLSKQPALLDLAAPLAVLIYAGWRGRGSSAQIIRQGAMVIVGWLVPVLLAAIYFAAHGALRDAVFYTWSYNLAYYGPEVDLGARAASAVVPFRLIGGAQPWLLACWLTGALAVAHRLLQRQPAPGETAGNPGLVYVAAWSLAGVAGAAAGGRSFDHYTIQFLAPFCLGAGLTLSRLADWIRPSGRRLARVLAAAALAIVAYDAIATAIAARGRTWHDASSARVSAYIREQSGPSDRIFVWGYHPDIYVQADRRPASRFLYASFLTGLVPWTNVAPDRDTTYAIVPGAMDQLLADLAARPPLYIVDCSAGPNRHWQKYPLEKFPALQAFIRERYRLADAQQFVPQGFRLYRLRRSDEPAERSDIPSLAPALANTLVLGTLAAPLTPVSAQAQYGANVTVVDGRSEYFAHAPSSLVYRLKPEASVVRGGFGLKPGAYAPDNPGPTDGAEFVIRWRPEGGKEQILLRRLLRPREEPADRGLQSFRFELPPHGGGELEFAIGVGPNGNYASDWTFWADLLLENYR
jgi:4-amino-4-deoxy-L-arabinose transferase-like glycosyltransferase